MVSSPRTFWFTSSFWSLTVRPIRAPSLVSASSLLSPRTRGFAASRTLLESEMSGKPNTSKDAGTKSKPAADPRPSSSVILVSPQNTILLLHRVQKSSAFPSAHVFPGGNLDEFHDGKVPRPEDPKRHEDNEAYRMCAIRETFEESGILLARNNGFGRLIEVSEAERDVGRKKTHASEVSFTKWLAGKGGRADVDGLIPFTRWITPTTVPKRFTTQMYLYFLPLAGDGSGPPGQETDTVIPTPTHDGGIEHTAARFLPAAEWIKMAQSGEIILFPPQLFLLELAGQFLSPTAASPERRMPYTDASKLDVAELQKQRTKLKDFVKRSDPPWGEKVICPNMILRRKSDKRSVLGLERPGPELEKTDRRGEFDRVVLVSFSKEGPRNVEVRWRKDVFEEERESKDSTKL